MANNYRVRLVAVSSAFGLEAEANSVDFPVTPTFSESRSVEYTAVTPIHMPGGIQVYKNSGSRTFNIGAPFISRSSTEAYENMYRLQTLRSWTLPFFGQKSSTLTSDQRTTRNAMQAATDPAGKKTNPTNETPEQRQARVQLERTQKGVEFLGAPPMVLYLYAYSTSVNDARPIGTVDVNINRIPVVITNLEIVYPDDVDYIPATLEPTPSASTEPFPVKMSVTITLVETHSPREYEQFSLADYYRGKLVNF